MLGLQASIQGRTAHDGQIVVRTEVIGLDQTIGALARLGPDAVDIFARLLMREAEAIIDDAKAECPVNKDPKAESAGTLRASGHVEIPQIDGMRVTVNLGFGGPDIPYALRQHEELSYRHETGKAKYLEDPFRRHVADMDTRFAAQLSPLTERGGA